MTKFVAMYLRVSTFDQAHNGYGLGDQEVQCRKYIDLYFPNDEVKIYKDDGYSAKNLSRPEMKIIRLLYHLVCISTATKRPNS